MKSEDGKPVGVGLHVKQMRGIMSTNK